jgi:hypothetical protein
MEIKHHENTWGGWSPYYNCHCKTIKGQTLYSPLIKFLKKDGLTILCCKKQEEPNSFLLQKNKKKLSFLIGKKEKIKPFLLQKT